jgi:hypothetical protein
MPVPVTAHPPAAIIMRQAHVASAPVQDEGSGWQEPVSDAPPSAIGGPIVASQYSVDELQVSEPEPHVKTLEADALADVDADALLEPVLLLDAPVLVELEPASAAGVLEEHAVTSAPPRIQNGSNPLLMQTPSNRPARRVQSITAASERARCSVAPLRAGFLRASLRPGMQQSSKTDGSRRRARWPAHRRHSAR